MKARRDLLGLILIIGMLLSCAAASYATATKAPKFTTSKISDATWGNEYEATISVSGNTTSKDAIINVSITDKVSTDLQSYGLTVSYNSEGGLDLKAASLSSDVLAKLKSGYKFTVTATNQYEKKAGDGKWQSGKTTKDYTLKLKTIAPKFVTKSLSDYTKAGAESNTIEITGSKPFSIDVYITKKDAVKFGIATTKDIVIFSNDTKTEAHTGFRVTSANSENGITLTLAKDAGKGGSFKKLPITIEAQNVATAMKRKSVKKSYKVTMTGEAPKWVIARGPASLGAATLAAPLVISEDFKEFMFTAKSADALSFSFKASGDGPMKITVSPKDKTAGLNIKISADAQSVDVYASNLTEAKTTKLKLVAENGEGKVTFMLSLIGQDKPKIDYNKDKYYKDVEQGKKFSFTPKLKSGTKPIKWYIKSLTEAEITANPALITSADLKNSFDIEIDEDKGTLSGTPTKVTLSGDNKTFRRRTVLIYAQNAAGSSDIASVDIGVKGSKPKLDKDTKAFEITRAKGKVISGDSYRIKADGLESRDVIWSIAAKSGKTKMSDYVKGLELVSVDGTLSGEPTVAVKASVPVLMDHYGAEGKASVKITIYDPTPKIVSTDNGIILIKNVKVDKDKQKTQSAYTARMTLTMSDDYKATGKSKIAWKITNKPGNKALSVKITKGSDANVNSATVTVTLAKGKELEVNASNDIKPFTDTFSVSATNSGSNKSENKDEITLTIQVASADVYRAAADNHETEEMTIGETKALEEDIVTDEELTAELGEGDLTIGTERTLGMLTSGQTAVLDEGRFVIAAILPEISATADGQYGLEVDLLETVKPGAKLYWFAFPKDAEDSEDDKIADFFDVEGKDTEVVPDDHIVVVYPWLRAGVTYGPVIAVKAEDAEEGEAVTQGELEEAAEGEEAAETTEVEAPAPAEEAAE